MLRWLVLLFIEEKKICFSEMLRYHFHNCVSLALNVVDNLFRMRFSRAAAVIVCSFFWRGVKLNIKSVEH